MDRAGIIMHKITKEEARVFIESQEYNVILSAKLDDWSKDEEDADVIYFPMSKEEFIKEISEELMVWDENSILIGDFTCDWRETLEQVIDSSLEIEDNFTTFCKANDILED